jgi:hypothetical protein
MPHKAATIKSSEELRPKVGASSIGKSHEGFTYLIIDGHASPASGWGIPAFSRKMRLLDPHQ